MEGTIVLKENKQTIDKFRKFYKEKLIDTKVSETSELILDTGTKIIKGIDSVKLVIADVVIAIFAPETLPIMPLVNGLINVKNKLMDFGKNKFIEGKRYFEAKFIKADGSHEDVIIPDENQNSNTKTLQDLATNTKDIISEFNHFTNKTESTGKVR